jgi:hypothetical protein
MAHVLVEATPGAATSAPNYGVPGVGTFRISPGSCRAPRAFHSRSQGQVFASGDPTGLPLGLAHLGFTCRLLAPAGFSCCGKTGPRTSITVPVNDTAGAGNAFTGPRSESAPRAFNQYPGTLGLSPGALDLSPGTLGQYPGAQPLTAPTAVCDLAVPPLSK